MLTSLRSKTSSLIAKGLFVILIASFAVWGVGDMILGRGGNVELIEVGPVAVSQTDLQDDYRRQLTQLQALYGTSLDSETAKSLGLVDRVVNDIVARALMAVYTKRLGMRVPDDQIRLAIRNDPTFRNQAGEFDRNRFDNWLRRNGLSEAGLVSRLRNDIARSQITVSAVAGVQPPQSLVRQIYAYRHEQRVAETLRIPAAGMTDIPEPDDAALAAFHEAHADRYQAPEYRAVTLVRLSPERLADEIHVADDDIAAAFENRKHEFSTPERRHLEQIVLPSAEAAGAAVERLKQGADFATVAQEETGSAPIDLGTVSRDDLAGIFAPLAEAAFTTPEGGVSAPTETTLGVHLVHVLEIEPATEATLAEYRDRVARDLALEQAADSIISIANQFEDELAGGATLEEAAASLDLPVTRIAAISAAGTGPDGTKIAVAAEEPDLAQTAFEAESGEVSPLTDAADGGYYILRVDGVTPAATRPLAEIRDRVRADWLAAERAKAAAEQAAAVVERLQGGANMSAVAAELGVEMHTSAPVTRDGRDAENGLSPAAVERLFALEPGGVAAVADGDDQIVLRLAEIREAQAGDDPDAAEEVSKNLRGTMSNDVMSQFMTALQHDIPVSINRAAIDRLF